MHTIPITQGYHEIVWDVLTKDMETPGLRRGSGMVWLDDLRFLETVVIDFEDDQFDDDLISFSGIGRWKIDDSLPGPKTGIAAHSPRGLLAGDHSTMEVKWNSANGGFLTFDFHLGMGRLTFLVDDELRVGESRPGQGNQVGSAAFPAGEHVFSFKYEPPPHANLPLSNVWIDNIVITV